MPDISKIRIPNPNYVPGGLEPATITYDIKDSVARAAIVSGFSFHIAVDAATTPEGVTWDKHGTKITGTLVASEETTGFYLVPSYHTQTKDIYSEYITIVISENPNIYAWECIGNTELDFDHLAKYLDTNVSTYTNSVLGKNTTITAASSSVSFVNGASDTFIKSYSGASSNLVKDVASKATAGTPITVATSDDEATATSHISAESVLENADVISDTLVFSSVNVDQDSVLGVGGTETITPYTFSDVDVATGSLSNSGTGDSVMTSLGNATTASAVTNIGSGTAAAQKIVVGTNNLVDAITDIDVTIIDKPTE